MSNDQTILWLRGLAKKGGKGVVNNIDARNLGSIADELERIAGLEKLHFEETKRSNALEDEVRRLRTGPAASAGSAGVMRSALEKLENANDALAGLRTPEMYLAMLDAGQEFALAELDDARRAARAALAAAQAQESVTADDVRKTITDEWGSSLCYRNSFGIRSCEQDHPNLGCRCGAIAKAIMADYSVSRPMQGATENTAAGEASTPPPDR